MAYYLIIGAMAFLVGLAESMTPFSKIKRDRWGFLLMLPMWLLAAFRSENIGNDTIPYMINYEIVSHLSTIPEVLSYHTHMENGYLLLVWLFSRTGMGYMAFQVFVQTFMWFTFFKLARKYALNIGFVCICLIFSTWGGVCNTLRMYLAITILSYSIPLIQRRKLIPFLLIVVFASLFHKSSLIFIIAYFLSVWRYNRRRIALILIVAVVVSYLGSSFFGWLTDEIGAYEGYVNEDRFEGRNTTAVTFIFAIAIVRLLFYRANGFFKYPQYELSSTGKNEVSIDYIFRMCFWISFAFSIVGMSNNIMNRVSDYFSFFTMFTMSRVITSMKRARPRVLAYLLWTIYTVAWFLARVILRPDWNRIVPYEWGVSLF